MNILSRMLTVAAVATGVSLSASIAISEAGPAKCGKRDQLAEFLKKRYQETPTSFGLSQKSTEVFEVYASEKGTWTITMTLSNGLTCVMAAGHSWQDISKEMTGTAS